MQAAVPHVFSEKETVLSFGTCASFSLTRQTLSSDEDSFCHPSCYLSRQNLPETEQLCALKNRSIRHKFWQTLAPQAIAGESEGTTHSNAWWQQSSLFAPWTMHALLELMAATCTRNNIALRLQPGNSTRADLGIFVRGRKYGKRKITWAEAELSLLGCLRGEGWGQGFPSPNYIWVNFKILCWTLDPSFQKIIES